MNKYLLGMTAASALFFATSASAALIVGFDADGSAPGFETTIIDNGIGDLNASTGSIVAQYNGFANVNLSSTTTNPFSLHMNAGNTTAGSMIYGVTLTDLTLNDVASAVFSFSANGTGVTATSGAVIDFGNNAFGLNDTKTGLSSTATILDWSTDTGNFNFNGSQYDITSMAGYAGGLFSLSIGTQLTTTGAGSVDATINVPEPSILALFGLGLVGMGFASRKKQA